MSSFGRSVLPDRVAAALALRSSGAVVCPEDVERAISGHAFFKRRAVPAPAPTSRFGRLPSDGGGGGGGGGRFGGFRGPPAHRHAPTVSEDGFETVTNRHRPRGGGGGGGGSFVDRRSAPAAPPAASPAASPAAAPASAAVTEESAVAAPAAPAKFSSAALRAGVDVEDRMLARVKGKINRLGHGTYDATKNFMQQILSSDDTDFLDELMKYIFTKASNESSYCPLYARLLHELGDEFPHFRTVIHTIFADYINVFQQVDSGEEPDPGSSDYKAFVEAQERKRGRRGYSQFVAELVKLGEADVTAFSTLLSTIVGVVEANHATADKTLMCEEYIDCFATMCSSAAAVMRSAAWSADLVRRMSAVAAKPRAAAPSISNKARFAIMDIADSAAAGWRSA
jgi:hypothetical protein